jgi:hypothetical protein
MHVQNNEKWDTDLKVAKPVRLQKTVSDKKIILLDSDRKFSCALKQGGSKRNIEVLCSFKLRNFSLALKQNENKTMGIVVDFYFIDEMIRKSLFLDMKSVPFFVVSQKIRHEPLVKSIPFINAGFVHKKAGVGALLRKVSAKSKASKKTENHLFLDVR